MKMKMKRCDGVVIALIQWSPFFPINAVISPVGRIGSKRIIWAVRQKAKNSNHIFTK